MRSIVSGRPGRLRTVNRRTWRIAPLLGGGILHAWVTARVDRQGRVCRCRRLERVVLRHGLRRQRPLHATGGGRRPRRGDGADHPHRPQQHARAGQCEFGQPAGGHLRARDRVLYGLRRRRPRRSPHSGADPRGARAVRPPVAGERGAQDLPAQGHRGRDGGADLQRRGHGAACHPALPRRAHRRQLGGKVHGGIVMRWIDEAAHVLATRWAGTAANVAVYSGGVRFYRPLRIGHLVEVEARLLMTGRASMHISVHVRSGDPADAELQLTTHSLIVFVPLGDPGAPLGAGVRRGRRLARPRPAARRHAQCGRRRASHLLGLPEARRRSRSTWSGPAGGPRMAPCSRRTSTGADTTWPARSRSARPADEPRVTFSREVPGRGR